jgi:Fic family protein
MEPWNIPLRIETLRSGFFVFQAGVDAGALQPLIDRVEDAHRRFSSVPILPDIATQLEKEVVVSSVFGTNTIEGGTLTEAETALVLETPENAKEEKDIRVINIRRAYDQVESFADRCLNSPELCTEGGFAVLIEAYMIKDLQKAITSGLAHPYNVPGEYRANRKGQLTKVGDAGHGGVYTPPKCREDVELLMNAFLEWINSKPIVGLSPLIRAPLAHYYFERIHPFWDGNGRVGRVLEAMIMKCAGYKYAPFALSKYYLENIDAYFMAFNQARKAEGKKQPFPNQVFVSLFLGGMLEALNRLHDRVNRLIGHILYRNQMRWMLEEKRINLRQYTMLNNLLPEGLVHDLGKVKAEPWYRGLYAKRTAMTQSRDMRGLANAGLIEITGDKKLRLLVP